MKEITKFNKWMNDLMRETSDLPLEKQKEVVLHTKSVIGTKLEQLSSVIQSELEDRVFMRRFLGIRPNTLAKGLRSVRPLMTDSRLLCLT